MSKYFIFENEKEIKDIIDSRLMSNGYGNFVFYDFDNKTEEVTIKCTDCNSLIVTNLPNIEDGKLEYECVYCAEIEKNKKLTLQKEIAEIISWNHLNLISVNEDDFYIKCEMCGREYFLDKDFTMDDKFEKLSCKNMSCFMHVLFHNEDNCENIRNNFGIKFIDRDAYVEWNFTSDIYEKAKEIYGHFQFKSQVDGKVKILDFENWLLYYDDIYHSYECDDYQTGIYDEQNNIVEIICKKCGNRFLVDCKQYHNEDFECCVCNVIDEKEKKEREIKQLTQMIRTLKSESITNISQISNKNRCMLLKTFCKELAKVNRIVYLSAECPMPEACNEDCSLYKAELNYLESELNKRIEKGEKISLAFLNHNLFI